MVFAVRMSGSAAPTGRPLQMARWLRTCNAVGGGVQRCAAPVSSGARQREELASTPTAHAANSRTDPRHLNGRTSEAGQMSAPDYTQRLTDRILALPGVPIGFRGLLLGLASRLRTSRIGWPLGCFARLETVGLRSRAGRPLRPCILSSWTGTASFSTSRTRSLPVKSEHPQRGSAASTASRSHATRCSHCRPTRYQLVGSRSLCGKPVALSEVRTLPRLQRNQT